MRVKKQVCIDRSPTGKCSNSTENKPPFPQTTNKIGIYNSVFLIGIYVFLLSFRLLKALLFNNYILL